MDFESLFIFHLNVFDDHHLLAYDTNIPLDHDWTVVWLAPSVVEIM